MVEDSSPIAEEDTSIRSHRRHSAIRRQPRMRRPHPFNSRSSSSSPFPALGPSSNLLTTPFRSRQCHRWSLRMASRMGNVGAQRAFRAVRTTPHHSIYRSRHRRLLTAFLTALGHNSNNLSSIITTGRSVVLRSMLSPLYTPITLARRPAATESLCYYITPLHIVHMVAEAHSCSFFTQSRLSRLLLFLPYSPPQQFSFEFK